MNDIINDIKLYMKCLNYKVKTRSNSVIIQPVLRSRKQQRYLLIKHINRCHISSINCEFKQADEFHTQISLGTILMLRNKQPNSMFLICFLITLLRLKKEILANFTYFQDSNCFIFFLSAACACSLYLPPVLMNWKRHIQV